MEYYLGYDVSHLTDQEWSDKVAQLNYVRDLEAKEQNKGKR
ncbi:hypothetical protein [Dysgonomonas sp. 520]|nr:hypothetical protein [Dysgonomonas sp. 520]